MAAPRLSKRTQAIFGTGDFTVNTVLSSLSLVYTLYFLIQIAELRPALAGLVPLVGRIVDAFTDPLMGRLSDLTRTRWGRRRPYFLLGAIPFGVAFALLWGEAPFGSQEGKFFYYASIYIVLSVSMTVLSVPYLALMPEMTADYDERTSLNTWRNAGSVLGTYAAVALRPVAGFFGGGAAGFAATGVVFGVLVTLPWFAVFRVTFERPDFQTRESRMPLLEGIKVLLQHKTYLRLMGFYLSGRIAMDLVGAMLIPYFTFYMGRSGDFEPMMFLFLTSVILWLPVWLRISRSQDKSTAFVFGAVWWMVGNLLFLLAQPDWPRWIIFAAGPIIAFGYAVADLMPWAMIGDVVDEDDLETGERREGLYNGFFTFLRKLAGAAAVALAGLILDVSGLQPDGQQPESAIQAVRLLTGLGPAIFIGVAAWLARGYPLTRERHERVLEALAERDRAARSG